MERRLAAADCSLGTRLRRIAVATQNQCAVAKLQLLFAAKLQLQLLYVAKLQLQAAAVKLLQLQAVVAKPQLQAVDAAKFLMQLQ
jgi:hypothetical protein